MFKKKLSWQDYDKHNALKEVNIIEARRKIRIGVIDDDPFQALVNLRSNGYEISFLSTTSNVNSLEEYNIIVCDILDVGMSINKEEQGAALIGEIKRVFPEKQVIAFSSLAGNTKLWRLAKERADDYLSKSSQLDVWYRVLDEAIIRCLDPKIIWGIVKERLADVNATTDELSKLEDAFIRALKKGHPDPLNRIAQKRRISPSVKSAALNIANSAFWTLAVTI